MRDSHKFGHLDLFDSITSLLPHLIILKVRYLFFQSAPFASVGTAFAWGMGSSQQLGQTDDEADVSEPSPMVGKNLSTR